MGLDVAADDRTGAIETAAALADRGAGDVTVTVWPRHRAPRPESSRASVVDLATRHLDPETAGSRAAALGASGPVAHKIDSTLRGNWAAELVARHRATARPVLLVPALPALGRTCVDGVVLVDGMPVHESASGNDVRGGPRSSRPIDTLASMGAHGTSLRTLDDVERWLAQPDGVAIADAANDATIDLVVECWSRRPGVILAGSAAVIGAAAGPSRVTRVRPFAADGKVLIVCGSAHPTARAQIAQVRERGAVVIVSASETAVEIDAATATKVAGELADRARRELAAGAYAAVIVIGGDTAAALLGDADVVVHGLVAPGTAWLTSPDFEVPIITRAGGFGGELALVDLLQGTLRS